VRALAVLLGALVLLTGCSATQDAVATGTEFTFVAPGGQLEISYPRGERQSVAGIAGESLLRPGTTIGLDDYAGQVVVFNVWGSWCGPCRREMPELQFVDDTVDGAAVLGLNVRDDRDGAADFVGNTGVRYDSIFDNPARTLAGFSGLPRNITPITFLLDEEHRVAAVYLRELRSSELIPVVEDLVAE
jgi:thiol-disulfide isomerase/thioredoxin